MKKIITISLLLNLIFCAEIQLIDGTKLNGEIISSTDDIIELKVSYSQEPLLIERKNILNIIFEENNTKQPDNYEPNMMQYYASEKKSTLTAIALEWFLPVLGYAYADNWKRGLLLNGLRVGTLGYAIANYQPTTQYMSGWVGTGYSYSDDCIVEYSEECERWHEKTGNEDETNLLIGLYVGLTIYQSFDLHKTVKEHNENLYRIIFKKEPPSYSLRLQPTYQGANLTMSYSLD